MDAHRPTSGSTQGIPSIRSSELSDYYNIMTEGHEEEDMTRGEELVDKIFREIGGCGCF